MGTTVINSFQDGPRLTVSTLVKSPTAIPKRVLQNIDKEFLADAVLRKLPPTQSGVYEYHESTPLFADGEAAIVEEFGEIPTISGREGERKVAFTVKRALAILVSREMRDRNNLDRLNTQIKQVRNTFIRTWEVAFLTALLGHPDLHTINASAAWDDPASAMRHDLGEATTAIEDSGTGLQADNYFGFSPNTLIIGRLTRTAMMESDDFNRAFKDVKAGENVEYTGRMPGRFYNVDNIMVSREMDVLAPGKAVLLEKGTVGGIGDERPMSATPLREDPDHETWRTNTVRRSGIVIDQPKAACVINGVLTP